MPPRASSKSSARRGAAPRRLRRAAQAAPLFADVRRFRHLGCIPGPLGVTPAERDPMQRDSLVFPLQDRVRVQVLDAPFPGGVHQDPVRPWPIATAPRDHDLGAVREFPDLVNGQRVAAMHRAAGRSRLLAAKRAVHGHALDAT